MPTRTEREVLLIDDREVAISNPDKVLFPEPGHTKLDLARYYLAVAEGALARRAGGRTCWCAIPTASKASTSIRSARRLAPPWIEVVALRFPSGRGAEEVVPRDAAALAWLANLACLELHPHPVRAEDLDHPDELRVDLDPVPGVTWTAGPGSRGGGRAPCSMTSSSSAGRRRPARAACTSTCVSNGAGTSTKCAAPRSRSRVKSSGARRRSPPASGGRRSGTACSSTTTRTPRTAPSPPRTRCGRRPTRASRRRSPGTRSTTCDPADFTLATMPARFAKLGDLHAEIDRASPARSKAARALRRAGAEGWAMRRGRRITGTGGGASARAAVQGATRRRSIPLIEIGRARRKEDALAGVERWKARHPEAAAHLQPADVLVDAMRGRYSTWTRIRVNLQHVPEELRPAQEPLDPDEITTARAPLELVGRRDFELIVAAVLRPLVGPPAQEDRRVAEAIALHVVVLHLADALDPQRLPRQVLAGAPAALRAGHAARFGRSRRPTRATDGPPSRSCAAARAPSTSCLRIAIVNDEVTPTCWSTPLSSYRPSSSEPTASPAALVPAKSGHDAVGGARVLDLDHRALARQIRACLPASRSRRPGRRLRSA